MTLEELDKGEGEHANGEVEAVGRELTTGEMIHAVVMLELADHLLEQSALFVKVDEGLSIFFLLGDVGSNDPVVVIAVEEIALIVATGSFDNKAKGMGTMAQCVWSLPTGSQPECYPCFALVSRRFWGCRRQLASEQSRGQR